MRVLLSTPPAHYLQAYTFKYPRFPWLSLPALAATIRDRHEVRVVSQTHLRTRPHDLDAAIADFRPDLLAFAAPAPLSAVAVIEHLPAIKARHPRLPVVCGGHYPTFVPGRLLAAGCDAVVLGEGERAFPALVDAIAAGADLAGLAGVAAVRGGKTVVNPAGPVEEDLDRLPMPAFDLWPRTHRTIYREGVGGSMETARGCPYRCTFCALSAFHASYRAKSPERVVAELDALSALGVREVMVADGTFGAQPEKAVALADAIAARKSAVSLIAFMRAETAARHPDLIERLARAGLERAIVGFECYSSPALDGMGKSASMELNLTAARVFRERGVFVIGSHFYGYPQTSYREALATYRHGVRISDQYLAGLFTPLPGTHAYDDLRETGRLLSEEPDQINFTRYLIAGGPNPRLFQALTSALYLLYYASPRRWLGTLFGSPVTRPVLRSEYRLLFWRVFFSLARKLRMPIL